MNEVSIYDGRLYLGRVIERDGGKRCEAYDASGRALGVFTATAKAATAVCEAAHAERRGAAA